MREYELVLIVQPDLDENAFNDVLNRVVGWIAENSGEILKTDMWGKRPLAYPIRKHFEGHYVLLQIKMETSFGIELERNLRFLEPVIRYLLVKK
jgi:small subunit ribosomal protein S6